MLKMSMAAIRSIQDRRLARSRIATALDSITTRRPTHEVSNREDLEAGCAVGCRLRGRRERCRIQRQHVAGLAKKESRKTVFPPMRQVVEDMDKIARDLQDIKTVLCCIAYQQDDKTLQVPFTSLAEMPKGIEMEIAVDRVHGNYVFTCILPPEPKGATLAA